MYEFIRTAAGWRVFWGIDPSTNEQQVDRVDEDHEGFPGPVLLPFQGAEREPVIPSAA